MHSLLDAVAIATCASSKCYQTTRNKAGHAQSVVRARDISLGTISELGSLQRHESRHWTANLPLPVESYYSVVRTYYGTTSGRHPSELTSA
ncbi:hypothetical protein [Paenibacillus sp. NAIST15-1]|uniref:hypothetical protein n=1 Tax=Paenibacillus sp. NAIST15-1 TaxID=1605994 RepID=UPI0015880B54|nr:hypothetical protein [Paenibacillus sp. NAIST15-1]